MPASNERTVVYFLSDPRKPMVARYIGISSNLSARYLSHLVPSASSPKKRDWIKDLRSIKSKPMLTVIGIYKRREAVAMEEFLIRILRAIDDSYLTNNSHQATFGSGTMYGIMEGEKYKKYLSMNARLARRVSIKFCRCKPSIFTSISVKAVVGNYARDRRMAN